MSEEQRARIKEDAAEFVRKHGLEADINIARGCYEAGARYERELADKEIQAKDEEIRQLKITCDYLKNYQQHYNQRREDC